MSKYDSKGQDIDDLLKQVDALLDNEPTQRFEPVQAPAQDTFDVNDYSPFDAQEDFAEVYQNFSNGYGTQVKNYSNGYGRDIPQPEPEPQPVRQEPVIPAYNADFHDQQRRERNTNSQAYKAQQRKGQQSPPSRTDYPEYSREPVYREYPDYNEPVDKKVKKKKTKKKRGGCGCGCLSVLVVLVVAVVLLFSFVFKQPISDVSIGDRKSQTSTILICGADIGNGRDDSGGSRTDTMMLLYLSGSEDKVGLLSLPRDTYTITSAGNAAKLNSAYGRNGTGEQGMEGLLDYVQDIIGYRPDGYVLVDMTLVTEIADLMGGIDIEVPMDMSVDDVTLSAGMQHLDGKGIITMLRYRYGYANADLGRVSVQRDVIQACMEQWLSVGNISKLPSALSTVMDNSITDLSVNNFLWIGKTLLTSMSDGFATETLPGYAEYRGGVSYYILYRDQVASMINESYNPYQVTIDASSLNIAG